MNKFGEYLRSLREIFIVSRRNSLIFAEEPAFQVGGFIHKIFLSLYLLSIIHYFVGFYRGTTAQIMNLGA
jgi:hypothetical protein